MGLRVGMDIDEEASAELADPFGRSARPQEKCKPKGKMNRRDFSKGVSAIVVGSQPGAHKLLAAHSAALDDQKREARGH